VPNPADDGEVRIVPLRLGLMDEIGVLVAESTAGPAFRLRATLLRLQRIMLCFAGPAFRDTTSFAAATRRRAALLQGTGTNPDAQQRSVRESMQVSAASSGDQHADFIHKVRAGAARS